MLVLILIDVQYSQKVVNSLEKGSIHQDHSSGSFHPLTPSPVKFLIPPTGRNPPTPYCYLENPVVFWMV